MPAPHPDVPPRDLKTYGRSRAVRLSDYDYAGGEVIHLTICAARGQPFRDASLARCVSESIEFYSRKLRYQLFGYCLMPDHLHVLLSAADSGTPIAKWLMAFKNYTGRVFAECGGSPPLWQRSAHDHVCREGETAEKVLAYIVNNPVRAGLCQDWRAWAGTKVFIAI
jgi:REP element-mobilizing transposase RayT